jgi:ribA/ribD-fused uncharacterized protein
MNSSDFAGAKAQNALTKTIELENTVEELKRENDDLKRTVTDLKNDMLNMQCHSRRDNLIFVGIAEQNDGRESGRNCEEKLLEILSKVQLGDVQFERVHRLGPNQKPGLKPRHVIAKFSSFKDRESVWLNRFKISQICNIWIMEDFPAAIKKQRQTLMPALKAAQRSTDFNNAFMKVNKLIIDGKVYTTSTIKDLPASLQPEKTAIVETEDSVAFFTKNAIFSNLNPLPIKVHGTVFCCNEQYFQHQKALQFDDTEVADQILKQNDPYEMMNLAKKIKNYKHKIWMTKAEAILTEANYAKYRQNASARDALFAAGNKRLGEASSNTFYGTGVGLFSKHVCDTSKWHGKNVMGEILTKIRSELNEQTI